MSWGDFFRREWGAVTFVVTVVLGLVFVPLALYLNHSSPTAVPIATPTPSVATGASTATPALVASPSPSPSKSP